MDPNTPTTQTTPDAAWHEGIITKGADGQESLADFALWKDKAPAPLAKFITDNMTAARAKTEGMFKVPGADAKPEEWDPIWKALGRPDDPDGYGIAKPEKMPDGVEWNDDFAKGFAQFAHQAGLSKAHAEKLIGWHTEQMGAQATAMKQAGEKLVADERKALTEAFGVELPNVAAKAQALATKHGLPPSMFDPAAGDFLGAPALKLVAALSGELEKFTKEGGFGAGGGTGTSGGGYDYAQQVIDGKHPDSAAYWNNDKAIAKKVLDGIRARTKAA